MNTTRQSPRSAERGTTARLFVATVAAAAALIGIAQPAAAEVRYSSDDATTVARSAAVLGLSADEFHITAASVHHFLLGVSGELETPAGGCALGLAEQIVTDQGPHRHSAGFADTTSLDAVATHYCITADQAHRANAALLAFLVALDSELDQAIVAPPPGAGTPVALPTGLTPVGAFLPAGRYSSITTGACTIRRIGAGDPGATLAAINADGGEQLVVDVLETDAALDIGSGCGSWFRVDGATPPAQPGLVIPPGRAIVGIDVEPGTYRSTTTGVCGIARLSGFQGTFAELVETDLYSTGDVVLVSIDPTDVGFSSNVGCGAWERLSG